MPDKPTSPAKRPCPDCGGTMRRDTRPQRISYKGLSIDVQQPGWYCGCGEVLLSEADVVATDGAYLDLRARLRGC